jgi:hypothetical protein
MAAENSVFPREYRDKVRNSRWRKALAHDRQHRPQHFDPIIDSLIAIYCSEILLQFKSLRFRDLGSTMTPPKAEYIGADQFPLNIFRLQLCGGAYIPIIPF